MTGIKDISNFLRRPKRYEGEIVNFRVRFDADNGRLDSVNPERAKALGLTIGDAIVVWSAIVDSEMNELRVDVYAEGMYADSLESYFGTGKTMSAVAKVIWGITYKLDYDENGPVSIPQMHSGLLLCSSLIDEG